MAKDIKLIILFKFFCHRKKIELEKNEHDTEVRSEDEDKVLSSLEKMKLSAKNIPGVEFHYELIYERRPKFFGRNRSVWYDTPFR